MAYQSTNTGGTVAGSVGISLGAFLLCAGVITLPLAFAPDADASTGGSAETSEVQVDDSSVDTVESDADIPASSSDRDSDQADSAESESNTEVVPEEETSTPRVYLVKPGDSLAGVSGEVGVSVDKLVEENHIVDPNLIYADSALEIPGSE